MPLNALFEQYVPNLGSGVPLHRMHESAVCRCTDPVRDSFTAVVVSELALQPSFMRIISELPSFNGFRQESALHRAEWSSSKKHRESEWASKCEVQNEQPSTGMSMSGLPKKEPSMSDLKKAAKDKIDATADAAKKATGKVIDKAKDLSHTAGKKADDTAKKLKDA